MKKARCILLLLLACALCGCTEKGALPGRRVSRVLLAYMAADNNLAQDALRNLEAMAEGLKGCTADARVIAYLDTPGENPRLLEITAAGQQTLATYPEPQNSASAGVLRGVIEQVCRTCPADRYGLVLSSHGMAWVHSSATGYFVRSYGRTEERWPATKYFGQDTGVSPAGYIEADELAGAIPDGRFDYILFDACFMASAEVLYALRDKAAYIVSSPAEVITDGFPYAELIGELLADEPDLERVCRTYYEHYALDSRPEYRAATVSLTDCSQLEALADATRSVYAAAAANDPAALSGFNTGAVQPLDRYRRHFLFDMGSVVSHLENTGAVPAGIAGTWRAQLARTVVAEYHTPSFFGLRLDACCGLSTYIPVDAYPDLNDYYRTLEWYGRAVSGFRTAPRQDGAQPAGTSPAGAGRSANTRQKNGTEKSAS